MTLEELLTARDALAEKMRAAIEKGEKDNTLTVEELDGMTAEFAGMNVEIASRQKAKELLAGLGAAEIPATFRGDEPGRMKSLSEAFLEAIPIKELSTLGKRRGFERNVLDVKAASDTHTLGNVPPRLGVEVDRTPVRQYLRRPFITDWLLSGTLAGSSIAYYVEKGIEGEVGTVAENTRKPQLHHLGWDEVVETLKKVAGFIKVSNEMLEDAAFLVSEIEARLLAELALAEEMLLLEGDGVGTNPLGILNRPGVQTASASGTDGLIEEVFRAGQNITLATGLTADGVVMNPTDFQGVRLERDANGQFLAGGPFIGAYGNGGVIEPTRIWGMPIIVTPAIDAGTVLVGASLAATVYSKGTFDLAATNTNEDDFVNNRVTILAERRIALAVRRPLAFVKITVSGETPEP